MSLHKMKQHGLTQHDLIDIASQGVVSEILSGKRRIHLDHAKKLGKRFGVPYTVFIEA